MDENTTLCGARTVLRPVTPISVFGKPLPARYINPAYVVEAVPAEDGTDETTLKMHDGSFIRVLGTADSIAGVLTVQP